MAQQLPVGFCPVGTVYKTFGGFCPDALWLLMTYAMHADLSFVHVSIV